MNLRKYDCACFFAWLKDALPKGALIQLESEYKRLDSEPLLAHTRKKWGEVVQVYPHRTPQLLDVMSCWCPSFQIQNREGSFIKSKRKRSR